MNKEEITEIAKIAVREAFSQRDKLRDEEFDIRYHDVGLLMSNYRKLKAHYSHILPDVMGVDSICSLRRKTGLMMSHVDKMLVAYKAMCYESGNIDEIRRWDALQMRYIDTLV